jgi:hypothetical protein
VLIELTNLPDGVDGLEAVGILTADDYANVFAPLVDRARQTHYGLRLLYQFGPDFKRITASGLLADARLGMKYLRLLDGCAIVSDNIWIRVPSQHSGRGCPAACVSSRWTNEMKRRHG